MGYPVGYLEDVKINFMHFESDEHARDKWKQRVERINYENIFILMTDRDGCTYEQIKEFDDLPFKNKVIFVHKPYTEFKSAVYIRGFEGEQQVGMCMYFKGISGKKYYDDFDYVEWFNGNRK